MAKQVATKKTEEKVAVEEAIKDAQTQEEAKAAMENAALPKYHFLMRIVGGQGIDGVVQTGPELDQTVNDWLDRYDIETVHYLGPFRDPSSTVLGHQFAYHLVLKDEA